ncbi:MAG: O-antigen ligase family protein [Actinomycetota bacterium]
MVAKSGPTWRQPAAGAGLRSEEGAPLFLDVVGLVLVGVAAAWMAVVGAVTGTDSSGVVALLVAAAAVYAGARALSRLHPLVVPAAIVGATFALWLAGPDRFLSRQPNAYPLGYANANGEFLVHAAVAALLIAAGLPARRGARFVAGGAAVVLGLLPFASGSLAAGALGVVVLAIGLGTPKGGSGRATVAALAAISGLALATTVLVATAHSEEQGGPGGTARVIEETVTERRVVLWNEALGLMGENPSAGIGVGRFEHESPIARGEEDIRWVPNAFLEQGAEAGVPGLILAILLAAWGFARLWVARGPGWVTAIGAASWGTLVIHACMDYAVHFPAVPLAAAAVLGAATSDSWE